MRIVMEYKCLTCPEGSEQATIKPDSRGEQKAYQQHGFEFHTDKERLAFGSPIPTEEFSVEAIVTCTRCNLVLEPFCMAPNADASAVKVDYVCPRCKADRKFTVR